MMLVGKIYDWLFIPAIYGFKATFIKLLGVI